MPFGLYVRCKLDSILDIVVGDGDDGDDDDTAVFHNVHVVDNPTSTALNDDHYQHT